MTTGLIKTIAPKKMYGFIKELNSGVEYFFHKQDFQGDWSKLESDFNHQAKPIEVQFEVVSSPKGPRAADVRRM